MGDGRDAPDKASCKETVICKLRRIRNRHEHCSKNVFGEIIWKTEVWRILNCVLEEM